MALGASALLGLPGWTERLAATRGTPPSRVGRTYAGVTLNAEHASVGDCEERQTIVGPSFGWKSTSTDERDHEDVMNKNAGRFSPKCRRMCRCAVEVERDFLQVSERQRAP